MMEFWNDMLVKNYVTFNQASCIQLKMTLIKIYVLFKMKKLMKKFEN